MAHLAHLPERAIIEVAGEDRVSFLQGIVSNDVALAAPGHCVWAALLTPQGKWLADFFIFAEGDALLLDVEAAQAEMLVSKLSRFRLRAKVTVSHRRELSVFVAWGGASPAHALAIAPDPRLRTAGSRIVSATALDAHATPESWDAHRLALGLPDGSRDMEVEKSVLLEAGFAELNGVSWTKGCYMGQELTARTHYRGLVKRRLVPVEIVGTLPAPGTPVMRAGSEVGTMRSGRGPRGLALLRVDALAGDLVCGGASLAAHVPAWMHLPTATPTEVASSEAAVP